MPTDIDRLQIEIEADSQQAGSALDRLTASLQRLQSAVGNNTALQKTSQRVKEIAKAPSLTRLEKELSKVEKQAIKDGDSLVELQKKLEELQGYKGVGNRLTQADTNKRIAETTAKIRQLSDTVDSADAKIRELRQSIKDVQAGSIPTIQVPKTSTSKQTSIPTSQTAAQIRQAATATQGVGNAAAQVKANLDEASKSADHFGAQIKKATSSGSGGFASLARSIAGMAKSFIIFGAIFSISGAIGDSFQRMAQENENVNATMSELKSSLQFVSDALASAIFPIVQAIAPIVVTILDAVGQIFNFIALIISTITGQDYAIQAQKTQTSFAESLDGTADSMDGVTSSAKKMKRELIGIDELTVLSNPFSGGGGASGSTGLGDLRFDEVPIDPIQLPEFITSPAWSPDPVPAPAFEPVVVPEWAGEKLPSPSWQPDLVPAPAFGPLVLPDWLTEPITVPAWEKNPVPSPVIDLEPTRSGLLTLQEEFSLAWSTVTVTALSGVTGVNGALDTLAGRLLQLVTEHAQALDSVGQKQETFVGQTQAALQAWSTANQANFGTTMQYIQTVIPTALSNAAASIQTFVGGTADGIAAWGSNMMANAQTTLSYIATSAQSALQSAGESFTSWISATSSNFAQWGSNIITNAGKAAEGLFSNIVSGLSAAWEQFKGAMQAMGEAITGWWSANKSWAAPAIGVGLVGLTIGAIAVSGGGALAAAPALAALANGGVLTEPTAALVGEYPGAKRNPEIVTPQNLMYDTFRDAQDDTDVINAIVSVGQQIVQAIRSQDNSVSIDGRQLVRQTYDQFKRYEAQRGASLVQRGNYN